MSWASFGRDYQYQTAQAPLPQEPAVGPGGYAPEIAIGPRGLGFGTPASLGRKKYPDDAQSALADLVTWLRGAHQLQAGVELASCMTSRFVEQHRGSFTTTAVTGRPRGWAGGLDHGLHLQREHVPERRLPLDHGEARMTSASTPTRRASGRKPRPSTRRNGPRSCRTAGRWGSG